MWMIKPATPSLIVIVEAHAHQMGRLAQGNLPEQRTLRAGQGA